MARIIVALALVCLFAGAQAQSGYRPSMSSAARPAQSAGPDIATLTLEFDNRGSKVQGQEKAMVAALAKAFGVTPKQVSSGGVIGQSSLFNHQSVASFTITGPSSNGKSAYDNCLAVVKKGWFSKSQLTKDVNKASDSWMPGDSLKVEKATCGAPGRKNVSGRKML